MTHLGFKSCKADPDIWIREAIMNDGTEYWEYVLMYIYDCLVVSQHGKNCFGRKLESISS